MYVYVYVVQFISYMFLSVTADIFFFNIQLCCLSKKPTVSCVYNYDMIFIAFGIKYTLKNALKMVLGVTFCV